MAVRRVLVVGVLVVAGMAMAGGAAPVPAGAQAEAALTGVTQVDAGDTHTCARLSSGQARCWGSNSIGQLGDDNAGLSQDRPVAVRNATDTANLTGVIEVQGGGTSTCARVTGGQVRCWGENGEGELGDATVVDKDLPVPVRNVANTGNLSGVVQLAVGESHACALLTTAQVVCWGDDDDGQLGDGTSGGDRTLPAPVRNAANTGNLTNVAEIRAGQDFTCARLVNGQVRCWGENDVHGQVGDGTFVNRSLPRTVVRTTGGALTGVTQLSFGGEDHQCARLGSGQVWCWGDNDDGQLGDGAGPQDAGAAQPVQNATGDGNLAGAAQVEAGGDTTCARVAGGQLRCFGAGESGQVGDGDALDRGLPVAVRTSLDSANLRNVAQVTVGDGHACARLTVGRVLCWGLNGAGQLGIGSVVPQPLPAVVLAS